MSLNRWRSLSQIPRADPATTWHAQSTRGIDPRLRARQIADDTIVYWLMLKTLYLNRDMEYQGGVSNVLLTLAFGNGARADFRFASLMNPSDLMRDAFRGLSVDVICFGDSGYLKPVNALRRYIKAQGIDYVVASSFKSSLVAKIASAGLPCRVVHYVHAIDLMMEGRFKRKLFGRIAHHDPMLFVSHAVELAHRPSKHLGPAAVIYNGVRDPMENPQTLPYPRSFRAELGVPDEALLLCYIGAFIGWKDHPTLLRAVRELDPSLNVHLLLIGEAEAGSTVEQQVATMNNPRIKIIRPRPDARRILGCVDVYVHSSRREGFGLAVVEAMLAGCPVVASREGAFPEYIEDGVNGMLAESGDPESFARQIELLAHDPEMSRRIATKGRESCLERFSPLRYAMAMRAFLEHASPRSTRVSVPPD